MAAVDYELLAYRRIKDILLAHAPLMVTTASAAYIKPASRVWYDGTADDPEFPTRDNRIPTDYPRLALEPSGMTQELWPRQRYGDHNVNATAASLTRNVTVIFNYTLRLTHRNLRLAMNTPVEAEVVRALRGSNPTMSIPGGAAGYSWVRQWGEPLNVTRTMGVVEGDDSGTARMQSVIPISVVTQFNSADLLT